ncbi:MAG TPA: helix-turn-helix transcriptional regulator [Rubrobacter sp.]|nr:helix-turn-helix transcriptional regulator [Rubrobacter sp.]
MEERESSEVNGERLRDIRMSRGLTPRRLEEHSGVSYEHINELELGGGVAEGETVEKLAEALDVEPSELLVEDT